MPISASTRRPRSSAAPGARILTPISPATFTHPPIPTASNPIPSGTGASDAARRSSATSSGSAASTGCSSSSPSAARSPRRAGTARSGTYAWATAKRIAPTCSSRRSARCTIRVIPTSRVSQASPDRAFTRRAGITPWTCAASAWASSAPAPPRRRWCRASSTRSSSSTCSSARRSGCCRRRIASSASATGSAGASTAGWRASTTGSTCSCSSCSGARWWATAC